MRLYRKSTDIAPKASRDSSIGYANYRGCSTINYVSAYKKRNLEKQIQINTDLYTDEDPKELYGHLQMQLLEVCCKIKVQ